MVKVERAGTSSERGQDLVEFALILPLLLLMLFGIIEFGIAVWKYNTISNVGREVARYGAVHADPDDIDAYIDGELRRWHTGIINDGETFSVTYELPAQSSVFSSTIRVTVTHQHRWFTSPIVQAVGGSPTITLRTVSTMQTEVAYKQD